MHINRTNNNKTACTAEASQANAWHSTPCKMAACCASAKPEWFWFCGAGPLPLLVPLKTWPALCLRPTPPSLLRLYLSSWIHPTLDIRYERRTLCHTDHVSMPDAPGGLDLCRASLVFPQHAMLSIPTSHACNACHCVASMQDGLW